MVRCLLILCASLAVSFAKEPLDVSADLAKLLENSSVPGMAAAAVLKGEVVATGVAGVRKLDEPQKVELGDHFHVGSCTKSMTASLAAMIIADGKIGWDTKMPEVFKDFEIHPDYREATLRQMLSNSGGVPHELRSRSWDRNQSGPEQRKGLVKDILSVKRNRRLLAEVMARHGFEAYAYEWWHFDLKGWKGYPVLDIGIDRLAAGR